MQERNDAMDLQEMTAAEESEKRRQRRQAQAQRERQRSRRRKEGLPTNFLLVNEYTKKPYGVGVGDWRKELMLLSRKLDPVVGNINQQLERAVAEIAEWIQHTWKYSAPIKFAFVREVIARGVTLRRADLWKKIRNNEPKPEDVSDKSWRILEKQMLSPATMKKSESCSRANASRVYFGRTRPSGEVGVRERLRRILRRSPDLEEIRFEMSRDKGYGGRVKATKEDINVMPGSESNRQLAIQVACFSSPTGNSNDNNAVDYDSERQPGNASVGIQSDGGIGDKVDGRSVLALSDVQIAQHPLVMQMMERLEALEGKQKATLENRSGVVNDVGSAEYLQEEAKALGKTNIADRVQVHREDELSKGAQGSWK